MKILLANEATKILHGKIAAQKAEKTAKETFESGGIGKELPEILMKKEKLKKGLNILELLSTNNITSSKSEARRAIKGNAIKLDNEVLLDENKLISIKDFKNENVLKYLLVKKNIT